MTGPNGTGKTTILNILARHFDWPTQFLGVPFRDEQRVLRYASRLRRTKDSTTIEPRPAETTGVGTLRYTNGVEAELVVSESGSSQLNFQISPQQPINGLAIPSHRAAYGYQQVTALPPQFNPARQALDMFLSDLRNRYYGSGGRSPLLSLKETLLAAALYSASGPNLEPNLEARSVLEGFEATLGVVLPEQLGFLSILAEPPEVVLHTTTGDFPIDSASGGVMAIIEVAWQIFLRARYSPDFVVCFDEPENHLHPALQRLFLPKLIAAFPGIQFVVATHSPFVCASVAESNVYVLAFGQEGQVRSELLDLVNKAGSAEEILRDVLGVPVTYAVWVEQRLGEVIDRYSGQPLTRDILAHIRRELGSLGLSDLIPQALADLFDQSADQG